MTEDDDLVHGIAAYTKAYEDLEAFVRGPQPGNAEQFTKLWDTFKEAESEYDEACRRRGWTPPYRRG